MRLPNLFKLAKLVFEIILIPAALLVMLDQYIHHWLNGFPAADQTLAMIFQDAWQYCLNNPVRVFAVNSFVYLILALYTYAAFFGQ